MELSSLEITLLWADCPLTERKQEGVSGISSATQMAVTVTIAGCTSYEVNITEYIWMFSCD